MDAIDDPTTALRNLLLAQLVYELGEDDFGAVQKQLKKHPLLQGAKSVPQNAQVLYESLLDDYGLERGEVTEDSKKKVPKWVETLAQKLYMAYTDQLLTSIKNDEEEFKQKVKELEEIKKGEKDDEL